MLKKFLLLLIFFSFATSSLFSKNKIYSEIKFIHEKADYAFIKKDYDSAINFYKKLTDLLSKNPLFHNYNSISLYNIPIVDMVKKRKALGKIKPQYVHMIHVIYLYKTTVTLKKNNKRYNLTLNENEIKETKRFLQIFKLYTEVISNGFFSLKFTFDIHYFPIKRMKQQSSKDYNNKTLSYRFPILNSVQNLGEKIFSQYKTKDTFLFYYKSKGINARPIGGVDHLPLVSYIAKTPLRGRLLIPIEFKNGFVLFHELFHSIEFLSHIRPPHGFTRFNRKFFPKWKGHGQYDYYQWHFQKTLSSISFKQINFIQQYPAFMTEKQFSKLEKLKLLFNNKNLIKSEVLQEKADKLHKMRKLKKAFKIYKLSLKYNPYNIKSLQRVCYYYFQKKLFKKLLSILKSALLIHPYDRDLNYYQGVSYYNTKKIKLAIKSMSNTIIYNPDEYRAYYYRGFLYMMQEKYELAQNDYLQAIRINSGYKTTILNFLRIYLKNPKKEPYIKKIIENIHSF